jgi:hypothetical protein
LSIFLHLQMICFSGVYIPKVNAIWAAQNAFHPREAVHNFIGLALKPEAMRVCALDSEEGPMLDEKIVPKQNSRLPEVCKENVQGQHGLEEDL